MARIIYAVNGEGLGHAHRSSAIIRKLQKHHRIQIVVGSKRVYDVMRKEFSKLIQVEGIPIKYKNNAVDDIETAKEFLKITARSTATNYRTLYTLFKKVKPHVVITDFESTTSYMANIFRVPIICVCNNHAVTNLEYTVPRNYFKDYVKTKLIVKAYCPNVDYHLITTFFYPQVKNAITELYPPIVRKEVLQRKPCDKGYLLVYQTSSTNHALIRALKRISIPVICYGFNKDTREDNITFRPYNSTQLIADLANAKACIVNGGFTVITEALTLKKPVLCIPVKGQFEQILNALQIKKLGYGSMADRATEKTIRAFLTRIPLYQKNLKQYIPEDNTRIIKRIEEIIALECKKK